MIVLRPMPSFCAASMRRPRVISSAVWISWRLELARQRVPDHRLAGAQQLPRLLLEAGRASRPGRARRARRRAARRGGIGRGRGATASLRGPSARRAGSTLAGDAAARAAARAAAAAAAARAAGPWRRRAAPAPSPSASGRCSRAGARCRESRTAISRASAASVMRLPSTPSSRALFCRKKRVSGGMSSRRSRSAGRRRRMTLRRWNRSSRNEPGLDALLEVLVRRGDDAHVAAHRVVAADAVELAVGEHAQQARLQVERHVADLVEEQRAAVGLLEAAAPRRLRAGEGAALVAEQLGLEQVLRDRRGVDRDERAARRAGCACAARARRAPCRSPIRR